MDNIRKIRRLKGLTQAELSKRSGVSQSQISSIELGQKSPTIETLQKIANALCVCPRIFIPCKENCKLRQKCLEICPCKKG